MLTSTFNNHPISCLNSSAKIVINALPGAEVVHERMSRNLLVLVRKRIHQIMNFTQISLLRIWHRVSYLSPALGIAQSRASYQFHNLICGLDCGNRAIQKLIVRLPAQDPPPDDISLSAPMLKILREAQSLQKAMVFLFLLFRGSISSFHTVSEARRFHCSRYPLTCPHQGPKHLRHSQGSGPDRGFFEDCHPAGARK